MTRDEIIITISDVTKVPGRNEYYKCKITYKYGDVEYATLSPPDLEKKYSDNFLFIPDDIQKIFDDYNRKFAPAEEERREKYFDL
jgi:hypothetical protein